LTTAREAVKQDDADSALVRLARCLLVKAKPAGLNALLDDYEPIFIDAVEPHVDSVAIYAHGLKIIVKAALVSEAPQEKAV
jgi:hypothetical protein